jgi:DNA repair protein RecO (recombination protein O)
MTSYKTRAIVLKSYNLGEADKIIKLFSQDSGLISAVAKGSRKIKSKFGGRLELFNFVDLEISTGRSLEIIAQAEIIKSFTNIPLDFNKFLFCQLISEIILKTHFESVETSPILFKLIYVCFNEINILFEGGIYSLEKVAAFFMAKFLKITGYPPLINNCCKCGTGIAESIEENIGFSISLGGIICRDCLPSFQNLPDLKKMLTEDKYNFLCALFTCNLKDFRKLEVDSLVLNDIYKLIGDYIKYHIESSIDVFTYLNRVVRF